MGTMDPQNVGELIHQILVLTPQEVDLLTRGAPDTKLRDIEGAPAQVKCTQLGELPVKMFLEIIFLVPIYYPDTPIGKYIQKTLVKGAITGTIAGLSSVTLKQVLKKGAEETVKKALQKGVEETVKKALQEGAEETVKKALQEGVEETVKKALQEGAEEAAKRGAKEAAKRGAVWCAFGVGAVVEAVSFGASCYCANEKLKRNKITKAEFKRHVAERGGGAVASLACSTAGAAIGTAVIPIPFLGTFLGSVVGGMVGDSVGSAISGKLYDSA